ncbi:B3/B4 domain-containing protein [Aspergillus saccharolyticus JOP 1030-1]|uniref:B3/B4 tRNA-binding domain-containing protein n=1 Tax=Aspergillus saccharolyticus JOP 1030-1 TaxID=1450539 RepID=A0A318Z5G2_9EURO|nr:B3/B4 tRNA-binding domain-containing protein [Aspergillus saccharolyticus JOP 1030-1]PYH42535.1 B3/B4 tRNA-binding domain-containing protein [Aspergillus saccharolyticus JOP 1030-1]
MSTSLPAHPLLDAAHISPSIFTLRPDYRALLMIVENLPPGPSDETSEALLQDAETHIRTLLAAHPETPQITSLPHIAAWRATYTSFGAKPQKTRNSLEALTRRAATPAGLPRVNRLTDIYNALSIKHQLPFGGEDLDAYDGAPFLVRATGTEPFQTRSGGELQTEWAEPGEPVWCDRTGITCRRWNWRQGPRTALTEGTTRVLFIVDALGEVVSEEALERAADELEEVLRGLSGEVRVARRVIGREQV